MKKQDPEFYEYLKKTDAELLDFGAESDDEEEEEDSKQEVEEEAEEEDSIQDNGSTMTLTPKLMIAVKKAAIAFETKSIRALAKFVQAFRCACHRGCYRERSRGSSQVQTVSFSDQEQCCVQRHDALSITEHTPCCVIILITTQRARNYRRANLVDSYATDCILVLWKLPISCLNSWIERCSFLL